MDESFREQQRRAALGGDPARFRLALRRSGVPLGTQGRELVSRHSAAPVRLRFSEDGQRLVLMHSDGSVRVLEVHTSHEVRRWELPGEDGIAGPLAFGPNDTVFVHGRALWRCGEDGVDAVALEPSAHSDQVPVDTDLSPDGTRLVSLYSGTLQSAPLVFRQTTGEIESIGEAQPDADDPYEILLTFEPLAVRFLRSGTSTVVWARQRWQYEWDPTIVDSDCVWDGSSWSRSAVVADPHPHRLATGYESWALAAGRRVRVEPGRLLPGSAWPTGQFSGPVAVSPWDAQVAAVLAAGSVWTWSIHGYDLITKLEEASQVTALGFSPTGAYLAYGQQDGTTWIEALHSGVE